MRDPLPIPRFPPRLISPTRLSSYLEQPSPSSETPVGSVVAFSGVITDQATPEPETKFITNLERHGWMLCDGRSILKGQYPELYWAIGDRYGDGTEKRTKSADTQDSGGDDDWFTIPNYQGYFLRSVNGDADIDKDDKNREVGSKQEDALQSHAHNYDKPTGSTPSEAGPLTATANLPTETSAPVKEKGAKVAIKTSQNETRSINIAVYYMVRCR